MSGIFQDLRYAVRLLLKTPGFSLIAVATLALGIGGATAVFSLVNTILLKPLPFHDPDRLVLILESMPGMRARYPTLPACANHFERWRQQAGSFENMAALRWVGMTLSNSAQPRNVGAALVSSGFLGTLGVSPRLGRDFAAEEDQPGKEQVVIVTDRFWRSELAASSAVIGRSIRLDGQPHEIIGVLPSGFRFPKSGMLTSYDAETPVVDVFKPIAFRYKPLHSEYNYAVVGRLRSGLSIREAVSELNVIQAAIAAQIGGGTELEAVVRPFQGSLVGKSKAGLLLALAAVSAVLLIACVNLANLLLARGSGRRREMAIRAALGAARRHLLRQALAESLCLALGGGGIGVVVAGLVVSLFVRQAPVPLPRLEEVGVDGMVLAFAAAVTSGCVLLFGLLPAWRTARADPQEALQTGRRAGGDSVGGHRLRSFLVGAEVALSALLLVVAGLLLHSFIRVMARDRGVEAQHVAAVEIALTPPGYADDARCISAWGSLEDRISRLPGVTSVGLISQLPFTREQNLSPALPKEAAPIPTFERPIVNLRYVTPGYFETVGIRLLSGRIFQPDERQVRLAVISRSVARTLWPGQDPIGREFRESSDKPPYSRVVGVVADVPVASLQGDSARIVYHPYWDNPWRRVSIVLRSAVDPRALSPAIRRAIWEVEPEIPVPAPKTMARLISDSVSSRSFDLALAVLFSATALLLACLGVYGVLSYSVARRTGEIGVRLALGASASAVALQVLRRGMAPVVLGLGVGLAAALAAARLFQSMLFEVPALDLATFLAVPVLLGLAALAACLIPTLRAARIHPMAALRYE